MLKHCVAHRPARGLPAFAGGRSGARILMWCAAGIATAGVLTLLAPPARADTPKPPAPTAPGPSSILRPAPAPGSAVPVPTGPSTITGVAAPPVDAHGCPIPPSGPRRDGRPLPGPQAGASPSPDFPKPGTAGNCRPLAPNLAAPQPILPATPAGQSPAWWDISGQIEQAIDTWIGDLAEAMLAPVMGLFTMALLSEPAVTSGRIAGLWQADAALADSFYVLYVVFGGLLVMGYGTVQTRYSAKQIAPRLVLGIIASNLSLPVIGLLIQLTGAIAGALWSEPLNPAGLGDQVVQVIISMIMLPDGLTQIVMAIFALVVCVLALAVLVTCALRIAALIILTAIAPLVLATHALPGIDGAARLWWRCMGAVLSAQILQTLTFMLLLQVFCDRDSTLVIFPTSGAVTDFLVGTALLIIMLKIPGWMNRAVLGGSPRTLIGSVLRTAAVAALGYRLGVPGAYSTTSLTGRLIANRLRGGGGGLGPIGSIPPPGPRGGAPASGYHQLRGTGSSALMRAVATTNGGNPVPAGRQATGIAIANLSPAHKLSAPSPQPTPALAPGGTAATGRGLAPIGGRGFGSSRGSHHSGQMALWPVPKGQPVPQPGPEPQPPAPAPAPVQPGPGQLQLPGFERTPTHSPGPWPHTWRNVPAFTVPRERRMPTAAKSPAPAPPPAPHPNRFEGQQALFTKAQARAIQPKPPAPPRPAKRPNLAVVFMAPVLPEDGEA